MQASCINPNQTSAGSEGWFSVIAGGGYGSNSSTACGPGSPMYAILSTDAAVGVGSAETLRYIPPAGSTLNGGALDIGMYADGYGASASGTAVVYTPEYVYDGSNVFFQCVSGMTPCAAGGNDFTGLLELPAGRGGDLYLSAGCGGTEKQSCNTGGSNGAWSEIQLWWANLRLSNSSSPAASAVSGPLLEPGVRGVQQLALTATDFAGPGVYNVNVQADGQTLYSGTPDSNGERCLAVGSSGSALIFDSSQPCKQSESVALAVDTSGVRDGQHTLKVTVTDAAGNTGVVYDGSITTHNAPADTTAPSILTSGPALAGGELSAQHGEWSAPAGAGTVSYSYRWEDCDSQAGNCQSIPAAEGASYTTTAADAGHSLRVLVTAADSDGSTSLASSPTAVLAGTAANVFSASGSPNGSNASETAYLRLTGRGAVSRSFARRAFTITGKLSNKGGTPIGGATLDVREQMQGSTGVHTISHATTAADGAFIVHVPAGPSRLVIVGYRASSADPADTTQTSVEETVTAGVRMHITPRRTGATGSIMLAGEVSGPIPRRGVVVELLVHYRGHWEPFRDPRTDAHGRFAVRYEFQGAVGVFPFRAEVLGEQSGFAFASGLSTVLDVRTG